jgi:hypothetical protein
MENRNNQIFNKIPNYFDPLINNYSKGDLQTYLDIDNNQNIQKNINQTNFISNNLQSKISSHRVNNNSFKKNQLKRFNTQKYLRRINKNNQQNNNYTLSEEDDIVFAKKTNMYTNNNGKINTMNLKSAIINNDLIEIKRQNRDNDIINSYKKLKKNYNPKYYTVNNNNSNLTNNNNIILNNNILTKKYSNNVINYNYDLNSTMPHQRIKNIKLTKSNIAVNDPKLSLNQNQNINKNQYLNESLLLNQSIKRKKGNKPINSRTMTDYKKKNKNIRNDLSLDYGVGFFSKEQKINIYPKNNNINPNFILSNYLSERKNKSNDMDTENF